MTLDIWILTPTYDLLNIVNTFFRPDFLNNFFFIIILIKQLRSFLEKHKTLWRVSVCLNIGCLSQQCPAGWLTIVIIAASGGST